MPTDPVLTQLLADPDPATRLIAADRAADLGDTLTEAMLRLCAAEAFEFKARVDGWLLCWSGFGLSVTQQGVRPSRRAVYTYRLHDGKGWLRVRRHRLPAPCTPPPGLEAAVLAVLRRRLGELRGGGR